MLHQQLDLATKHYDQGTKFDSDGDQKNAQIEYKKALESYRTLESNFRSQLLPSDLQKKSVQEEHLDYLLNITETRCMLITYLCARPGTIEADESQLNELHAEFAAIKIFATRIHKLDGSFNKRIEKLNMHILHKEYIYRHNLVADFFDPLELDLPEDHTDEKAFTEYCKNKQIAIRSARRVIELLSTEHKTNYTINIFNKKQPTDAAEKAKFMTEFSAIFDKNFINPLAKLEQSRATDREKKIEILKNIIEGTTELLDCFEQNNKILECKFYFTLFKALQDLCELLPKGLEKRDYLDRFKVKLKYYLGDDKFPRISKPEDIHELLSYQCYVQQKTNAPEAEILASAKYFSKTLFPFSAEDLGLKKNRWVREMKEVYEAVLAVEQAKKYGRIAQSARQRQQESSMVDRNLLDEKHFEKKPKKEKEEPKARKHKAPPSPPPLEMPPTVGQTTPAIIKNRLAAGTSQPQTTQKPYSDDKQKIKLEPEKDTQRPDSEEKRKALAYLNLKKRKAQVPAIDTAPAIGPEYAAKIAALKRSANESKNKPSSTATAPSSTTTSITRPLVRLPAWLEPTQAFVPTTTSITSSTITSTTTTTSTTASGKVSAWPKASRLLLLTNANDTKKAPSTTTSTTTSTPPVRVEQGPLSAPSSRLFSSTSASSNSRYLLLQPMLEKAQALEDLYSRRHSRESASKQILSRSCFVLAQLMEERVKTEAHRGNKLNEASKTIFELYALTVYQFCLDLRIDPKDRTEKLCTALRKKHQTLLDTDRTIYPEIASAWAPELMALRLSTNTSDNVGRFMHFYVNKIQQLFAGNPDFKADVIPKLNAKLQDWMDRENAEEARRIKKQRSARL